MRFPGLSQDTLPVSQALNQKKAAEIQKMKGGFYLRVLWNEYLMRLILDIIQWEADNKQKGVWHHLSQNVQMP